METGITDIQYLPDFSVFQSVSPAIVNRATGVMYINLSVWNSLPAESRLFIMLHEAGHAALQTTSEHEADQWAFDQYAALGYPLTKGVYALSRVLKFNKPEDYQRLQNQLIRAAEYDYYNNHNQKAKSMMMPDFYSNGNGLFSVNESNVQKLYPKVVPLFSSTDGDDFGPPNHDYGPGSNEPGSKIGGWLSNVGEGLSSIANAFGTVVKGVNDLKQSGAEEAGMTFEYEQEKKSTWLWIAIAVAAVIAVIVTFYVVKQSKK